MKISTRIVAICSFLVLALVVSACTPARTATPAAPTTAATTEATSAATTEATVAATAEVTEAATAAATVEATEAGAGTAEVVPTVAPTNTAPTYPTRKPKDGAAATSEAGATTAAGSTAIRIGVVTDAGGIDDRSFNQSGWEGAELAAKELGGTAEAIVSQGPQDYAANIQSFADQGYDVIVTIGFALQADTIKAAQQYPNIHFIGVDQFQGSEMANVTGLIFPEDQSGFLAGVLAARLSKSGKIGAVLGTDQVPPVVKFKEGYEAGAIYANSAFKGNVLSTYHPAGVDKAFEDPVWGAQTAGQAIDQGADIIFGAGGKTGNGALQEVAKRTTKDKPLYCIGVDTDQWLTVPEAHPCLVSSAMKLITPGVAMLIKQVADGTIKGGNFVGEVDLAPFHDFESLVPDSVKEELKQIKADLASGKLLTTGEAGTGGTGDSGSTDSGTAATAEPPAEAPTEAAATMEATMAATP